MSFSGINSDGEVVIDGVIVASETDKTKLDAIEPSADVTDVTNVSAAGAIMTSEKGAALGVADLDSGGKVPASQLSLNNVIYIGTWNASTNTPTLSDSGGGGTQGDYYVVSVAGSTSIDGINDWKATDHVIHNGTIWEKANHTDAVSSIAGKTGAVTLDTGDIISGTMDDARIAQSNVDQHGATAAAANRIPKADGTGKLVDDWLNEPFLAADRSKLDGMENGATADQTAGEIEALANHDNLVGYSATAHLASGDNREVKLTQTINATASNLWTKTLDDNTLYRVKVSIIGRDQAGTERALYEKECLVYRQGAGAATIEGSVSAPLSIESNASMDCSIVVATNDVKLQVTGLASTTIDWKAIVEWHAQA